MYLFFSICWVLIILFDLLHCIDPEANCNEQGLVYRESNYTVCDCFDCFYGEHCESENKTCILNAKNGSPLVYDEYWQQAMNNSMNIKSVVIDPYYRTGYQYGSILLSPSNVPISPQNGINYYLRESIFGLHAAVGNVNTDNKYIVIGTGCTQLLNAVIYALYKVAGKALTVFAATPNYKHYHEFAEFDGQSFCKWNASYYQQDNRDLIEIVSLPNNPVGDMKGRYYKNNKYTVYDMVYDWPSTCLTPTKNTDYDIMLFSLSKLTGNAGTRIGYGFIKDPDIAQYMVEYIGMQNTLTSIDGMYRTLYLFQQLAGKEMTFFNSIRSILQSRWSIIKPLFNAQNKYSLLSSFGYYLWIQDPDTNVNLYNILLPYKIESFPGSLFQAQNNSVRINIVQQTPTFNLLVQRLKTFLGGS